MTDLGLPCGHNDRWLVFNLSWPIFLLTPYEASVLLHTSHATCKLSLIVGIVTIIARWAGPTMARCIIQKNSG